MTRLFAANYYCLRDEKLTMTLKQIEIVVTMKREVVVVYYSACDVYSKVSVWSMNFDLNPLFKKKKLIKNFQFNQHKLFTILNHIISTITIVIVIET